VTPNPLTTGDELQFSWTWLKKHMGTELSSSFVFASVPGFEHRETFAKFVNPTAGTPGLMLVRVGGPVGSLSLSVPRLGPGVEEWRNIHRALKLAAVDPPAATVFGKWTDQLCVIFKGSGGKAMFADVAVDLYHRHLKRYPMPTYDQYAELFG
jgi:hypothetical protein